MGSRGPWGVAAVIVGLSLGVAPATARETASRTPGPVFAKLRAATAPRAELRAVAPRFVPGGGEIHRFVQRVGGLPVFGSATVVADPPGAPPELVIDRTARGVAESRPPRVGRAAAIERARRAAGASRLRGHARSRLGIDPRRGTVAWEVWLPAKRPLADYLVVIDARRGRTLSITDTLRLFEGRASLFDPNPVVANGSARGLRDRDDRKSRLLARLRTPVVLERLKSRRGCLRGDHVEARRGRRERKVCKRSRNWGGVQRSGGRFEALMAYFHIDRAREYIDSLGVSGGLRRKPLPIRVNALRADVSFYSSLGRRITFGAGGVDDAEDGDVIVHEYGHAVQDQQVRKFGTRFDGKAMGEGFGDYLAAVMSRRATGGSPTFDPCVFEWDGRSYARGCFRSTDTTLTASTAKVICGRGPHCAGQAWSGALWDLRDELGADAAGRSIVDRALIESHYMLARRSNFQDGARALLAADTLLYDGLHTTTIEAEMIARDFCPSTGC